MKKLFFIITVLFLSSNSFALSKCDFMNIRTFEIQTSRSLPKIKATASRYEKVERIIKQLDTEELTNEERIDILRDLIPRYTETLDMIKDSYISSKQSVKIWSTYRVNCALEGKVDLVHYTLNLEEMYTNINSLFLEMIYAAAEGPSLRDLKDELEELENL